jgi:hypothetical protein
MRGTGTCTVVNSPDELVEMAEGWNRFSSAPENIGKGERRPFGVGGACRFVWPNSDMASDGRIGRAAVV